MVKCKYWDAGWCYAPDDVETNANYQSACFDNDFCPYLRSQMTEMTAEMFGANTPIVPDETLDEWLKDKPVKKMTEKELIKTQIEELQKKLKDIEEQESRNSPCEEAFKKVYGKYPNIDITDTCWDGSTWIDFSNGYHFAYEERIQEDYQPSMTNCILEGTPPDGYVTWHEWFNEMGSKGILHNLKISSIEHKTQLKRPEDNNWKSVALRFGEKLSDVGPCGYYDFSPDEWYHWVVNTYEKLAGDWLSLVNKEKQAKKLQEKDWTCKVSYSSSSETPQTLWKIFYSKGWNSAACTELCEIVEQWLPKEQSANSQNTYVELVVEGFNDALKEIKGRLR